MAKVTFSANGTGRTGTIQYYTVPETGLYEFVVRGAAGFTGTLKNSSTGATYSPTPGKGAVVTGKIELNKGDRLLIVVGQRGTSSVTTTTTNGVGGGSGGATWIFRQINSITDSTYQTAISGVSGYWECLFCAAGGCGTIDAAYKKASTKAPDASTSVYSLSAYGTYSAYSTSTASTSSSTSQANVVLSLLQIRSYGFNGSYYSRNGNYGYGGYGCGHTSDNDPSAGGGWRLSSESYRASSWAAYGGTASVYTSLAQGQATIELLDSDLPNIAIETPEDGYETYFANVDISGTVTDANGITALKLNGDDIAYDSSTGRFSKRAHIAVGSTPFTIWAQDKYARTNSETVSVVRRAYTPEELHPDRPQPTSTIVVDSVVLTPNPVDALTAFTITAVILQEYVYPDVDPLFEFPMDLDYVGLPISELVFQ